jgi:hypothetical protein
VRSLFVVALASVACGAPEQETAVDATPADVGVDVLVGVVPLDVLFVIDDSQRMQWHQPRLAAALAALDQRLGADEARPTLHVGVTSTDLKLPVARGDANCSPPAPTTWLTTNQCTQVGASSTYLIEDRDSENYSGAFTDALGCMVQLGHFGCGYEQPLEAMRLALGTPGFVRPGADLAVVILTDEDDCSVSSAAFVPTPPPYEDASFACFRHGVVCDPDEPYELGQKLGCRSREDAETTFPVQGYVDLLRGLKPEPNRVTVGIIAATATDAYVSQTESGAFHVDAHCEVAVPDAVAPGFPAIRLGSLAGALGDDAITATICEPAFDDVLDAIGARAYRDVDGACLDRRARAECDLTWTAPGETILQLPACAATGGAAPCWELRDDATCSGSLQQIHVVTDGRPVAGSRVQGSCRPG